MKNIYVFDMGCVLLKPANLKEMYIESNSKCDYNTFKKVFYNSKESTDVYNGFIDDDTFFKIVKEKTGSKRTVQELKGLYLKNKGGVYDKTIDIIKILKEEGNIIGLLSNIKVIDYNYLCSVVDMNLFDEIFLSYVMNLSKPDTRIYKAVIEKLGTNNFYFYDDSAINVEKACSLGINAFNVTGENIDKCFSKQLIKCR